MIIIIFNQFGGVSKFKRADNKFEYNLKTEDVNYWIEEVGEEGIWDIIAENLGLNTIAQKSNVVFVTPGNEIIRNLAVYEKWKAKNKK
ncbi:hypothetical protein RZN25_16900 [Bacillaceae bacterium S4-13-56]